MYRYLGNPIWHLMVNVPDQDVEQLWVVGAVGVGWADASRYKVPLWEVATVCSWKLPIAQVQSDS